MPKIIFSKVYAPRQIANSRKIIYVWVSGVEILLQSNMIHQEKSQRKSYSFSLLDFTSPTKYFPNTPEKTAVFRSSKLLCSRVS